MYVEDRITSAIKSNQPIIAFDPEENSLTSVTDHYEYIIHYNVISQKPKLVKVNKTTTTNRRLNRLKES